MRLTVSRPMDGPDQDTIQDDAWIVGAHNASAQTQHLDAIAVCGEGNYEYVKATGTVSAGGQGGDRVRCPGGAQVASGGFAATGSSSHLALSSMYPRDGGDADKAPDDVWVVRVDDLSGADRALNVHAVCKV
jgi:hypothetical protein